MSREGEEADSKTKDALQVIKEIKYTGRLQRLVNYCNTHCFKNFKLTLVMEEEVD